MSKKVKKKKNNAKKKPTNKPKKTETQYDDTEDFLGSDDDAFEEFMSILKDQNINDFLSEILSADPLLDAFYSGLDTIKNEAEYKAYVDSFIVKNSHLPGIEEFAVRMQEMPVDEKIKRYIKLIQENLDEYDQTNWVSKEDFMRFDAEDHVLSLFSELNRIFADHKMYSRGISLCLHAIQFLEDDPYNFTAYLMTYYCALEKKDNVDEFLAVIEDAYDKVDVDILLPVSIFYYVYGDEERAREVLFEMMNNNTGTERFIFNYDQIDDELDDYYMNEEDDYHPYTFETFAIIYDQMYWYIMDHDDYFTWAKAQLEITNN